MLTPMQAYDLNIELARKINGELLLDPNSPYHGKWIGLADGQVVLVADSQEEVLKRLDEIEPNPRRTFAVEGVGRTEEEQCATYGDYGDS